MIIEKLQDFSSFNVSTDTPVSLLDFSKKSSESTPKTPLQRKTTLKWGDNGELSAVDMARILEKLGEPQLRECDFSCDIKD